MNYLCDVVLYRECVFMMGSQIIHNKRTHRKIYVFFLNIQKVATSKVVAIHGSDCVHENQKHLVGKNYFYGEHKVLKLNVK